MMNLPDPERQPQFYEGVALKRLVAWIVDSVLILLISCVVVLFTAFVGLLVWPILYLTIGFAYRVVTLSNGSATFGMRLAGVELRTARGDRFDPGHAVMHTLAYTMCCALPVLQAISVVLMLTTPRGQSLGDMLLGTSAMNRRMVRAV